MVDSESPVAAATSRNVGVLIGNAELSSERGRVRQPGEHTGGGVPYRRFHFPRLPACQRWRQGVGKRQQFAFDGGADALHVGADLIRRHKIASQLACAEFGLVGFGGQQRELGACQR